MLIVKPYGRSHSHLNSEKKLRRTIHLNSAPKTPVGLVDFTANHPELVIAQWISAIDKIATKPKSDEKPTAAQRAFRQMLGESALAFLIENQIVQGFKGDTEELKALWRAKIHPYKDRDATKGRNPKGRWYARFCDAANPSDNDMKAVVLKIHEHLHKHEYRIDGNRPAKLKGRIFNRADSIEKSVLGPITPNETGQPDWSAADETAYTAAGDTAREIHQHALKLEKERKRVNMRDVAPFLYALYGRLFRDSGGHTQKIAEARAASPGLFALHAAVRDTYLRLLDGHKKEKAKVLPKDAAALFDLVRRKRQNRQVNGLVRLGKIIHYEASFSTANQTPDGDAPEGDTPQGIFDSWPDNIAESRYWTSDGQAEIKRNEAFVRVWRNVISLASRGLTDWADPAAEQRGDILGKNIADQVTGPAFDEPGYDRKVGLLFGERASFFKGPDPTFKKAVLKLARGGLAKLRNSAFHFKGRGGFLGGLQGLGGMAAEQSEAAATTAKLWSTDMEQRDARIKATMRAAHFEYFFNDHQIGKLFIAVSPLDRVHPAIPRFRRVLKRCENAWGKGPFKLRLPAPENRQALQSPTRLCRYAALKLLYEKAFPAWLAECSADKLNGFVERAVERTTADAKNINKDERAVARAAGLITLAPGETVDHLTDRLAAETASELRVQRSYESDGDKAKKQAEYIENLRCDVIAQAFDAYLAAAGFDWVLKTSKDDTLPAAALSDLDALPLPPPAPPPQPWVAVLYFLIHLVPVDDIGKLLHQLRKWAILEGRGSEAARAVERAFNLYLDMHDDKFGGGEALAGAEALKPLFESEAAFSLIFPARTEEDPDLRLPRRGLREMLRFGNLSYLMPVFEAHKITEKAAADLKAAASADTDSSPVAAAQAKREELHDTWVKRKKKLTKEQEADYRKALKDVVAHRHLAAQATLTNHVRLHRLLMLVLGRMVDYAGLWERDLYFVTLALIHLRGRRADDLFPSRETGRDALKSGQIVVALRRCERAGGELWLIHELKRFFGHSLLDGGAGMAGLRNDFAHFNMLQGATVDLRSTDMNLTAATNKLRRLMAYDRKLKNAVSKSTIELLHREGLTLSWQTAGHDLARAQLETRQATHIERPSIKENLHGDEFVAMAAALFDGAVVEVHDVRKEDTASSGSPQRRRKHKKPRKSRRRAGGKPPFPERQR